MAAFYNTATLSYRDTSTNSNTVEGQLVQVLAAEKTAVLPTYGSSNTVTYIVSIRNSGAAAYTGLTVTDDLGGYAFAGETRVPLTYVEGSLKYYSNGTLQPAPAVTAGAPLVIGGITVPAGGNALLIYEAEPNGYAPPAAGGTITNTASITGDGLTTPLTAQATVAAGETLRLPAQEEALRAYSFRAPWQTPCLKRGIFVHTFHTLTLQRYGRAEQCERSICCAATSRATHPCRTCSAS